MYIWSQLLAPNPTLHVRGQQARVTQPCLDGPVHCPLREHVRVCKPGPQALEHAPQGPHLAGSVVVVMGQGLDLHDLEDGPLHHLPEGEVCVWMVCVCERG